GAQGFRRPAPQAACLMIWPIQMRHGALVTAALLAACSRRASPPPPPRALPVAPYGVRIGDDRMQLEIYPTPDAPCGWIVSGPARWDPRVLELAPRACPDAGMEAQRWPPPQHVGPVPLPDE